MEYPRREISLGFWYRKILSGQHICYLYTDDSERDLLITQFLNSGLDQREKFLYLFNEGTPEQAKSQLQALGGRCGQTDQCDFFSSKDVYYPDGNFSTERVLALLKKYYAETIEAGFTGARVTGDMSWAAKEPKSLNSPMEFESRLSALVTEYPYIVVCQYAIGTFSGSQLMDVLSVHPLTIVRGQVIENPYFLPPQEFLKQIQSR